MRIAACSSTKAFMSASVLLLVACRAVTHEIVTAPELATTVSGPPRSVTVYRFSSGGFTNEDPRRAGISDHPITHALGRTGLPDGSQRASVPYLECRVTGGELEVLQYDLGPAWSGETFAWCGPPMQPGSVLFRIELVEAAGTRLE